jgi:hypothetical protein
LQRYAFFCKHRHKQRKIVPQFFGGFENYFVSLQANHAIMKEKKDNISFEGCAEPIGAVAVHANDDKLYSIDNWPGMPLVGPADIDEANARIDEAEREIDENGGIDWAEFKSMLLSRHASSYAI